MIELALIIIFSISFYLFIEFLTPLSPARRVLEFVLMYKFKRQTKKVSILDFHPNAVHWQEGDEIMFIKAKMPFGDDVVDFGVLKTFNKTKAIVLPHRQHEPVILTGNMIMENKTCDLRIELAKANKYQREVILPSREEANFLLTSGEEENPEPKGLDFGDLYEESNEIHNRLRTFN